MSVRGPIPCPERPEAPDLTSPQHVPANLANMMNLLINSLESARRDASNPDQRRQLQRFVKRIRRAKDDHLPLLKTEA